MRLSVRLQLASASSTNLLLLKIALFQAIRFIRPDRLNICFLLGDRLLARTHGLFRSLSLQSFFVEMYVAVRAHLVGLAENNTCNTQQERATTRREITGTQLIRLLKLKKDSNMVTVDRQDGSQHRHVGYTAQLPSRRAVLGGRSTMMVAAARKYRIRGWWWQCDRR
jgi:hypothetical protein